jgi:hypothetical protein
LLDLHDGISEGEKILLDPVGHRGSGRILSLGIHESTYFIDDFFASPRLTVQEVVACQQKAFFERLIDLVLDQARDY